VFSKGAAGRGKSKGGKSVTRSQKAGLLFPVGRIHSYLKKGKYAPRIGAGAPVYLAAVMEYLTAEVLELTGNVAVDCNRKRISPRHLLLAVRGDEEIDKLFDGVTIAAGGVIPHIHKALVPQPGKRVDRGTGGKYCYFNKKLGVKMQKGRVYDNDGNRIPNNTAGIPVGANGIPVQPSR
jgi:histone H2A